jgi:hypothetical protein
MINGLGGGNVVTRHMWEGVHNFPDSTLISVTIYSAYKARN